MSIDLAELQRLRDTLVRLRASGVRVTMYDGKRLEYKSDAEMVAAIGDLDRRIAAVSLSPRRRSGFMTMGRD